MTFFKNEINLQYNKSQNVGRNALFGFINRFFSLVLPFIIRTLVIYRFGAEYLGMNSLFVSVLQVLNLADFGFGTAIVYSLYRPVAEGDLDTVCAYLGSFRKIYRIIGCTILSCGLLVMPLLPYMIKDTVVPGNLNLYIWYGIFLLEASVSYLLYGYKTVIPSAMQRNDILSRIDILILLCKSSVQAAFLFLTDSFYFFLLTSLVFTVARNLFVNWAVSSHFPQYKCSGNINAEQVKRLKPRVYGILLSRLRWVSRNGIDSICLTTFLGLFIAAVYNNYLCIHNAVSSLSMVVCSAMMASVGNSIAMESRDKNYADLRRFNFMYMLLAGWASICFLCLYQPFMRLWVGEGLMLDMPEVIALTTYFYVLKMGDMRWVYFEGAGLWWQARYYTVVETLTNICLNILLAKKFGVLGIILATLISVFLIDFIFGARILFKEYFLNGKLKEFFGDHLRYFGVTVLLAFPCNYVCDIVSGVIGSGSASEIAFMAENGAMVMKNAVTTVYTYKIWDLLLRLMICTAFAFIGYYLIYHRTMQFKDAKAWVISRFKWKLSELKVSVK